MGHVETPVLLADRGSAEVRTRLEGLTLQEVKGLLDEAIDRLKDEQS